MKFGQMVTLAALIGITIIVAEPARMYVEHYTMENYIPPWTHDNQVFEDMVCPHCQKPVVHEIDVKENTKIIFKEGGGVEVIDDPPTQPSEA